MHNQPETLGCIVKAARENAGITIEALANKVDITAMLPSVCEITRTRYRADSCWCRLLRTIPKYP